MLLSIAKALLVFDRDCMPGVTGDMSKSVVTSGEGITDSTQDGRVEYLELIEQKDVENSL